MCVREERKRMIWGVGWAGGAWGSAPGPCSISPSCQWGGLQARFPEVDLQGWAWGRAWPESGLTPGAWDTGRCWEAGSTVLLAELEAPGLCAFWSRVWLWLAGWCAVPGELTRQEWGYGRFPYSVLVWNWSSWKLPCALGRFQSYLVMWEWLDHLGVPWPILGINSCVGGVWSAG